MEILGDDFLAEAAPHHPDALQLELPLESLGDDFFAEASGDRQKVERRSTVGTMKPSDPRRDKTPTSPDKRRDWRGFLSA